MKDPAFLFYPGDWLSGTLGMTFEEKGAYLELLLVQFNQGHMTEHIVNRIVGALWQSIRHKFIQDEKGLWYNVRLEQEQMKRSKFTDSRRKNISKRYEATYVGTKTLHMENENENENINKDKNESKETKPKFSFKLALVQFGFESKLIDEWLQVRKTKKMTNTETAFYNFVKEIGKVNIDKNELLKLIIANSWGGFKADWYYNQIGTSNDKLTGATASFHGTDYNVKM
jgi:hypothetical protein